MMSDVDTGGDYVALGGQSPESAVGGAHKKGARHTAAPSVRPGGGPGRRDVLRAPHAAKRHTSRSPKRAGAAADKKTELSEALLGCLKPAASHK